MKKIFIIIGMVLLVAGAALGAFTGLGAAVWIELAGAATTLALCITSIIKKAEKKDWKLYTAIIGVVVGVVLLVWAGIADNLITSIMTAVIGLVVLVLSVIVPLFISKDKAHTVEHI